MSNNEFHISQVASDIRTAHSFYDHRPFLPANVGTHYYDEQFRIKYAGFKNRVAQVLKPARIIEIGVGLGVSALAFLNGWPTAMYLGIDNDCEANRDFPITPTEYVSTQLRSCGYKFEMRKEDSSQINYLPPCDLFHVDGGHSYDNAYNDVMLAWRSEARWILVDDARDSVVAAATFDALHRKSPGSVDWAYFEDTWTGSILISRIKERP